MYDTEYVTGIPRMTLSMSLVYTLHHVTTCLGIQHV